MKKLYFLLIFLINACTSSEENWKEKLKGQWIGVERAEIKKDSVKFDPNEPPPPPGVTLFHEELYFYGSDSPEEYSVQDYWLNHWAYREDSTTNPYDGKWKLFRIYNKQLQVFESDSTQWKALGNISLKKDTLILQNEKWVTKFVRLPQIKSKNFEQIVLNSSGCFGTCPVMSIILHSNGQTLYYGENHTKLLGVYEGKIPERLLQSIWFRFEKAKIEDLKSSYSASHTDDEEIIVSFIRDNKVIKSVCDYGQESPAAFVNAYTYFMHRINNFSLLNLSNQVLIHNVIFNYRLKNSIIERSLLNSESFWLWYKLQTVKVLEKLPLKITLNYRFEKRGDWVEITQKNGKIVDKQSDQYTITLSNGEKYQVKNEAWSDGQFFKLTTVQGESLFLDIGTQILTPYILSRPAEYPYAPMVWQLTGKNK